MKSLQINVILPTNNKFNYTISTTVYKIPVKYLRYVNYYNIR